MDMCPSASFFSLYHLSSFSVYHLYGRGWFIYAILYSESWNKGVFPSFLFSMYRWSLFSTLFLLGSLNLNHFLGKIFKALNISVNNGLGSFFVLLLRLEYIESYFRHFVAFYHESYTFLSFLIWKLQLLTWLGNAFILTIK